MSQTSVGWPNVVGVFHKSCPKQRASYLLESTSDGTKTGPRFWCGSSCQRNGQLAGCIEVSVVGFSLVVFLFRAENVTKIHMALALSYGMAMFQCVACCRTDLYTQIYAQVRQ